MSLLADLKTSVDRQTTVVAAVVVALGQERVDPAAVSAIKATVDGNTDALSAALAPAA